MAGLLGRLAGRRVDVTVRPLFLHCSWLLSVLVHAWTERLFVVWLKLKESRIKEAAFMVAELG